MTGGPAEAAVLAVAGGIGCMLRAWVRDALLRRIFPTWWAVAIINVAGSLVMGMVAGGAGAMQEQVGAWLPVAAMGLLAGWTTYSAFTVDVLQLWLRGERVHAALLWATTLLGSPVLAIAGGALVRQASGGGA